MKPSLIPALLLAGLLLPLTTPRSLAEDRPLITWQGRTMGSPYTVQITGTNLTEAQVGEIRNEVEQRLMEINRQISNYQPDSELSKFNRAPANTPLQVSPEFARVVRFGLELSRRSHGAFDPTLGPVINLWGFGNESTGHTVPPDALLESTRRKTGWKLLSLTDDNELLKTIPDLALDLGGVGKGFGVDQMAAVLQSHGLTDFYTSIAGEVRVLGLSPRGTNWHLGISTPVDNWRETDTMAAGVWLSNQALSTSGDYQKFFLDAQGQRQCHIIDPRTGRPVQHHLAGVSVVAPDSMTADGLGTTLFVLGLKDGMKFIDSWTNAAALFIVRESDGSFRQIPSARFNRMACYEP